MTNRDYLKRLSNDKLAELLDGLKIFGLDCIVCNDGKCTKCITKWLDAKRETSVEKGQIRETDSIKWLVTSVDVDRINCSVLSEEGAIRDYPTDVVDTWKIVTDNPIEAGAFFNSVSDDLHKEVYNDLKKLKKEINKEI